MPLTPNREVFITCAVTGTLSERPAVSPAPVTAQG